MATVLTFWELVVLVGIGLAFLTAAILGAVWLGAVMYAMGLNKKKPYREKPLGVHYIGEPPSAQYVEGLTIPKGFKAIVADKEGALRDAVTGQILTHETQGPGDDIDWDGQGA